VGRANEHALRSFSAAGKYFAKLVYIDNAALLTMAIADIVLFVIKSVKYLQVLEIHPGGDELRLVYAEFEEDQVISRIIYQVRCRH
jgi:hypothetical protein